MKGDYSKIPFNDKKKKQHYRKAYLQQGRVLLDSDLNENTDLLQYQTKMLAKDTACLCGSPNFGFRIGEGVPLLSADDITGWSNTPFIEVVTEYFGRSREDVSLKLENVEGVIFKSSKPIDIETNEIKEIRVAVKKDSNALFTFFLETDKGIIYMRPDKNVENLDGFKVFRYPLYKESLADVKFKNITGIGFKIDKNSIYLIGEVGKRSSSSFEGSIVYEGGWNITLLPTLTIDYFKKFEGNGSLRFENVTEAVFTPKKPVDLTQYRWIRLAIMSEGSFKFFWKNEKGTKISAVPIIETLNGFSIYKYYLSNLTNQEKIITAIGLEQLDNSKVYIIGAVECSPSIFKTENNSVNFVIAGMDMLSNDAGRLYVNGDLYEKETPETYLNQKDYPNAPVIDPPTSGKRKDLIYADVWQRHITSVEDATLREVALGGPDTCNRMKAVAQVKVLKGTEVETGQEAPVPLLDITGTGGGRLSTVVVTAPLTVNPCEITPDADYTGWENRLYRIEIHSPGNFRTDLNATYKWSRNNASTVSSIVKDVEISTSPVLSVQVKDTKLFKIGDIIEITDDLVELADRETSIGEIPSTKRLGELRQIIDIDLEENKLIWEAIARPAAAEPLTGGLTRSYTAQGIYTTHPKVIKWDGVRVTSQAETLLENGVRIKFSGDNLRTGDYWTFTARVNTREVEKLDNEPPHGVVHHYCPLAVIEWENGKIITIEDRRGRFEPLCRLSAADIAFDRANIPAFGDDVKNVQQAIESIIFPENLIGGNLTLKCPIDPNPIPPEQWPKLKCDKGDMVFLTGGTERMRIKANGNVGIGTIGPISKLHIHGNHDDKGTGGFMLDANDDSNPEKYVLRINPFVIDNGMVGYKFQTKSDIGGTNVPLTFDNKGYVGIGTTSPLYRLHVTNYGSFGKENADGTSQTGDVPLVLQADPTVFGILNRHSRQAFKLNLEGNFGTTSVRGYPVFYDKYDGIWHSSIHLVKGNVGIGTNKPDARLTIVEGSMQTTETGPVKGLNVELYGAGFVKAIKASSTAIAGNEEVYGLDAYGNGVGSGEVYGIKAWGFSSGGGKVYGIRAGAAGNGTGEKYAGYFDGNVHVQGVLTKTNNQFLIDHPLDPYNKTLRHSVVESPEDLCLYRGKVQLDIKGRATVKMPEYFSTLTKEEEATVTLTPIGKKPILLSYEWNSKFTAFTIFGEPSTQATYIVLADRDDPSIQHLRRHVEEEKGNGHFEKGKLLFPEAFGQTREIEAGTLRGEYRPHGIEPQQLIEDHKKNNGRTRAKGKRKQKNDGIT